ncbi:hypothetical protein, partial [Bacillus altitudinis]
TGDDLAEDATTHPPDDRIRCASAASTRATSAATREGWLGSIEGLRISLTAAKDKLAQIDQRSSRATAPTCLSGKNPYTERVFLSGRVWS